MALLLIQPLTEMSTRNLPGVKGRPALKADNITDISEPITVKPRFIVFVGGPEKKDGCGKTIDAGPI
jgi:hypothetical protein